MCCIATSFLLCKNDHSFRFFCECLSDKKTLVVCFENSGVVGADTVMLCSKTGGIFSKLLMWF